VNGYTSEVKTLLDNMRQDVDMQNKMIRDKVFEVTADPRQALNPPSVEAPVPFLNFSRLENALASLKTLSAQFKAQGRNAAQLSATQRQSLNQLLYQSERSLLRPQGLPRRPWYRHQIYAPGFYTGYGVKTLPGIREGIEEKNWKEAQQYIDEVAITLEQYNANVQKALDLLK
jgi:N-acetylated-alpha-linked acidic dipeptidase